MVRHSMNRNPAPGGTGRGRETGYTEVAVTWRC